MKAFVIPQAGEVTVEAAVMPRPRIDDDELLVRVKAVGVGIHDTYFLPADASYPYPIGIEAAGVVQEVGSAVSGHRPGDGIAFVRSLQPKGGTWAEFVAVKASSLIMEVPADLDFVTAAALPVAGNTILRAFHALADLPAGATLFIAGASGAIGTLAIQLASRRGLRVAASASTANHDYMISLGAEKVVDYRDMGWQNQVREWMPGGVDAAIAVQPGTSATSMSVVRDGGQLVTISGDQVLSERGVRMVGIPYHVDVRKELAQLIAEAASGVIHVELERVYPFDEALSALAKVRTRSARGKSVLSLE